MSVMSCAPTAKPDETAARPAPASHIARPGPQTKAVIALAGDGPRRAPSTWDLQIDGKRDGLIDARRYA
jgi:hypothetical protein